MEKININGRNFYKVECSFCGSDCYRRKWFLEKGNNIFCSRKCESEYKKKKEKRECFKCGKKFERTFSELKKSKSGKNFCSQSCAISVTNKTAKAGSNHPNWKGGGNDYRSIAKKNLDMTKCKRCNWNEVPQILQVHHIDRNRKNSDINNLEVLCPNCHTVEHYNAKDGLYNNLTGD